MTNKTTRKALLLSTLSLLLCFAMLLGTTFAWFTDSVTSSGNKIQAGTLKVDLLMNTDGSGYESIKENSEPIFGGANSLIAQNDNLNTLWEPGKTQVAYLAIENGGSLDLKYNVNLMVKNIAKDLYEVMEYAIIPDAQYGSVTGWPGGIKATVGSQLVTGGDLELASGLTHYFALAIHMQEEAGNEYQGGQVEFDIAVSATQLNSEADSFGTDYDADSTHPFVSFSTEVPANATADETIKTSITEVTLSAALLNSFPAEVEAIRLVHSAPIMDAAAKTVKFEAVDFVNQSGTLVDLEALGNTEDITVKVYVGDTLPEGMDVAIYHDGEQVAMSTVVDKYIVYTVKHFCAVEISQLRIEAEGAYGGVNWTLFGNGKLIISPGAASVYDETAKKTYAAGEWREAVRYQNGSAKAIVDPLGNKEIRNKVTSLVIEEGVTFIGSFAAKFPNLTGEVVIPSTVTYIGQEAFQDAPITKLTFASGGTGKLCIAPGAFKKMAVEEIVFPADRPEIHIHCWALNDCTRLKRVTFPANVTTFSNWTHVEYMGMGYANGSDSQIFARCWALEKLTFGSQEVHDRFFNAPGNRSNINAIGSVEIEIQ